METTELVLKLAEIGWKGDLTNLSSLFDWLYREFQITIEKKYTTWYFWFGEWLVYKYFGIKSDEEIVTKILPDVTLLWKCSGGNLEGPSLDNFVEPEKDWT